MQTRTLQGEDLVLEALLGPRHAEDLVFMTPLGPRTGQAMVDHILDILRLVERAESVPCTELRAALEVRR